MKKIALFLLVSALSVMTLASCTSDNGGTTTDGKTSTPAASTGGAQTTAATTTAATTASTPAQTEGEKDPATPAEKAYITVWEDNNGEDGVYYEITTNEDGTVTVEYTKEDYESAAAHYGYAGSSWVNMKADISEIYNGQTKLVLKLKGEFGKSLLIKPFDDQFYEQTLNFDGNEQTIELDISEPYDDADMVIIMFGDGGATDASGTFTILEAYFTD